MKAVALTLPSLLPSATWPSPGASPRPSACYDLLYGNCEYNEHPPSRPHYLFFLWPHWLYHISKYPLTFTQKSNVKNFMCKALMYKHLTNELLSLKWCGPETSYNNPVFYFWIVWSFWALTNIYIPRTPTLLTLPCPPTIWSSGHRTGAVYTMASLILMGELRKVLSPSNLDFKWSLKFIFQLQSTFLN